MNGIKVNNLLELLSEVDYIGIKTKKQRECYEWYAIGELCKLTYKYGNFIVQDIAFQAEIDDTTPYHKTIVNDVILTVDKSE